MSKVTGQRVVVLDGVRGIAILLVVCAYADGTGFLLPLRVRAVSADVGVRVFFVLSGFLITSLLVAERARCGRISLREFYIRRLLRIFPAFYGYLLLVTVLSVAGVAALDRRDLAFAATYAMNFHGHRGWVVGQTWSLAVEEQFYLLWPAALALCGTRRARQVALAAILLGPLARLGATYGGYEALADQAFPCVFDALATGCLLALWWRELEDSKTYRRILGTRWFWPAIAALSCSTMLTHPWFQLGIATTASNVAIALAIHRLILRQESGAARVLSTRGLVWFGTISYSLYLWQQPFVDRHAGAWFNRFPQDVVLGIAAAVLSYAIVERPFIRWSARRRARSAVIPLPVTRRQPMIARPTSSVDEQLQRTAS